MEEKINNLRTMSANRSLTPEELTYIDRISKDMEYYKTYKQFMGKIKKIYLNKGPEQAKEFIRESADETLGIAINEMINELFTIL